MVFLSLELEKTLVDVKNQTDQVRNSEGILNSSVEQIKFGQSLLSGNRSNKKSRRAGGLAYQPTFGLQQKAGLTA
jgi:hypothetical protein